MSGHHEVRWFRLPERPENMVLPKGWKPLSAINLPSRVPVVVCRRWVWDNEKSIAQIKEDWARELKDGEETQTQETEPRP